MKTITCRQLGGTCDAPLRANSQEEMMKVGMDHVQKAHPDMAADIKKMSKNDPAMVEWQAKFDETWASTPDDK
ncbi:MAG: DUF1059 domain-containing protein [Patescibacteria group bacterium]|nr:DUF1059 domain-containing protein [Patescibacteria group bacterium]MDE2116563.1 DUF1059 domain-containing protein [Patescibacteria group bacterium]